MPPIPPKISVEKAAKFAEALDRSQVASTALSDKSPELIYRPRGSSKISA